MRGLNGKRVVITGGASGVGAAAVARFLDEACRVLVIDRDPRGAKQIKNKFAALTDVVVADVVDERAVAAAFNQVDAALGGVDILINNAGISIRHRFLDLSPAEWSQVLAVNLTGVFNVAQQAAKRMVKAGGGVIINMGSTNGMVGHPMYADYNASKAGVMALTKSLGKELAKTGILVNCITPAVIQTEILDSVPQSHIEYMRSRIPMDRFGRKEEAAAMVAWLCSEDCSFSTGAVFDLSGGRATY